MARITQTIDDLSGAILNEEVEPTTITVEGTKYTLDLGSASKERFIKWLSGEGALVQATPRNTPAPAKSTGSKATSADKERNAAVRHWATDNSIEIDGKTLGDRGRIPDTFIKAWEDAGSPPVPSEA